MSIIHRVLDLLIFIGDEEEQIEMIKCEAFSNKNLNISVSFHRIDQQQKGYIKACDIQDFLFSNGYQSNGDASLKYICHYDYDQDESLSLKEFERALLPQSQYLLKQEIMKRPSYNVIKRLPIKIEDSLFKIIKRQIEFYHKLLTKLTMILVDYNLDLNEIFNFIDQKKQGYINSQDIMIFFHEFGYNLYKEQIAYIIQSFDINLNNAITFREFSHLLYISNEQAQDILLSQQSIYDIKSDSTKRSLHKNNNNNNNNELDHHYIQNSSQKIYNNNQYKQSPRLKSKEKRSDSLNTTTNASRTRIISFTKSNNISNNNISTSFQNHLNSTYSQAKKRSISSNRCCSHKINIQQQSYIRIINKDLINVLRFLIEYSKRIYNLEQLKQLLLSQSDIDITIIFQLFDKCQRGYLKRENFTEGMYDIGLIPNNYELMLLFRRFGLESDLGEISFTSFSHIISPIHSQSIPSIHQKFINYSTTQFHYLSYSSQTLLRDYFSSEIENQIYKSKFVDSITKTPQFIENDLISILSKISTNTHSEFITLKEIEQSMKQNGLKSDQKHLIQLIEMINIKQLDEYEREQQQIKPNSNYLSLQNIVDEILYH